MYYSELSLVMTMKIIHMTNVVLSDVTPMYVNRYESCGGTSASTFVIL
jgi:hypothetical protein